MTYSSIEFAFDRGRAALAALLRKGEVTAHDICDLREILGEGALSRDEANLLFAIERAPSLKGVHWTEFFVEAVTDHVVWQIRPTGVVNESQGEWLIQSVDEAKTLNAFAALVNVMAEAHRVPLWFLAAVQARAARGWPGAEVAVRAANAEIRMAA